MLFLFLLLFKLLLFNLLLFDLLLFNLLLIKLLLFQSPFIASSHSLDASIGEEKRREGMGWERMGLAGLCFPCALKAGPGRGDVKRPSGGVGTHRPEGLDDSFRQEEGSFSPGRSFFLARLLLARLLSCYEEHSFLYVTRSRPLFRPPAL